MSIKRFDARRDATEPAIVRALVQVGALVLRLDQFDLLVLFHGRLTMLDCKTAKGKPTASQLALIAAGWPLHFVVTVDDALRVLGIL